MGIVGEGLVPQWLMTAAAVATMFCVMASLGIKLAPFEYRIAWRKPAPLLKGIFASLVGVPIIVIVVARAFDLPRPAEVGMVLMSICPGAPVALRRALGAGGSTAYALALQVALAVLAALSLPLSIAALDEVYAGSASVAPVQIAAQVLTAQLLPLGLGVLARYHLGARLQRLEPALDRLATALLVAFVAIVLVDIWGLVSGASGRAVLAIVVACAAAMAFGHILGGPDPATRTALAVSCAARNAGLAILVASVNSASPAIMATLLAYLFVSALTVTPYLAWRRRSAR